MPHVLFDLLIDKGTAKIPVGDYTRTAKCTGIDTALYNGNQMECAHSKTATK
jgi:hypothetical protein